jgi:hypothetical protein
MARTLRMRSAGCEMRSAAWKGWRVAWIFLYVAMVLAYGAGFGGLLAVLGWLVCLITKTPVEGPLWRDPDLVSPQALAFRFFARLWKPCVWMGVGAAAAGVLGAALYALGFH